MLDVEVMVRGILVDPETFEVLVVVTNFVVIMGFVDKVTDLVVSATGLMMVVKLMAELMFLLVGVDRSVAVVISVVMTLCIVIVDDLVGSATVLIVVEDLSQIS